MSTPAQLRVLVVRLGAMGDLLHALPAVTALRAAHPEWYLGWAVEPQWTALLAADSESSARTPSMPLVDALHVVPAKQWARRPFAPGTLGSIAAARRELRGARYDVALDLQGAIRSALVARWARPARILGEAVPREPLARHLFTERIATTGTHVIEQAAEVTRALAGDSLPLGLPALPHDEAAAAWCRGHAPAAPFALLSPGAGWGAKRWPVERYAELARRLAAHGVPVVLNAGPSERPLVDRIAGSNGARGSTQITVLEPTLPQLTELARGAALAIAGDTGPLHLAAALGCPTVAIFGPTDPARNGPFHGQAEGRNVILRHPESRRDHARRDEPEAGLLTITVDEVLAAAERLLTGCPAVSAQSVSPDQAIVVPAARSGMEA